MISLPGELALDEKATLVHFEAVLSQEHFTYEPLDSAPGQARKLHHEPKGQKFKEFWEFPPLFMERFKAASFEFIFFCDFYETIIGGLTRGT